MRLTHLPLLLFSLLLLSSFHHPSKDSDSAEPKRIPYLKGNHEWADSVLNSMSLDEKIGQLFNVAAYTNEKMNKKEVEELIQKYHIGGLTFFYLQTSGTNK